MKVKKISKISKISTVLGEAFGKSLAVMKANSQSEMPLENCLSRNQSATNGL